MAGGPGGRAGDRGKSRVPTCNPASGGVECFGLVRWFRRRRKGKPTVRWGRKVTGLSELAGPPNRPQQACRLSGVSPVRSSSSSRGDRTHGRERLPQLRRSGLSLRPFRVGPCSPARASDARRRSPTRSPEGIGSRAAEPPAPRQGAPPPPALPEVLYEEPRRRTTALRRSSSASRGSHCSATT